MTFFFHLNPGAQLEPWEGLDIDDSNMETIFKKCNSNIDLIPGPAGNVQAVLLNRESSEAKNTQEFVKDRWK